MATTVVQQSIHFTTECKTMAVAAAPQPTGPPGRTGEGGGRVRLDQKSRMMVMALPQPVVVCDVVWVYRAKVCVCVCV